MLETNGNDQKIAQETRNMKFMGACGATSPPSTTHVTESLEPTKGIMNILF